MTKPTPEESGRRTAARIARYIGCSGTHEHNGKTLPCRSHEELLAISKGAEPEEKSLRKKRKRKVSERRYDRWERLREKPIASLVTGVSGITSGSPSSEITDSGPVGSSGTAVSGGAMGGIVNGSFAKGDESLRHLRSPESRMSVTVPVERLTPPSEGFH